MADEWEGQAGPGEILPPGTTLFGVYQILDVLGGGGMGRVYRAQHNQLGVHRAIKVIRPDLTHNANIQRLFIREARALTEISHDAVARCHELLSDRGCFYLVMELVDGPSLEMVLRAGPMDVRAVRALWQRIGEGLTAVHAKGIIHRDISPGNIVLPEGKPEKAKLIDFGTASVAAVETIMQGEFRGKFAYASPEQLGQYGGKIRTQSDIYSFGLVLAEAASGDKVYRTPYETRIPPEVPAELREDILKLLEPDPAIRPVNAFPVLWSHPPKLTKASAGTKAALPFAFSYPPLQEPTETALPQVQFPAQKPASIFGNPRRNVIAGSVGIVVVLFAAWLAIESKNTKTVVTPQSPPPHGSGPTPLVEKQLSTPATVAPGDLSPPSPAQTKQVRPPAQAKTSAESMNARNDGRSKELSSALPEPPKLVVDVVRPLSAGLGRLPTESITSDGRSKELSSAIVEVTAVRFWTLSDTTRVAIEIAGEVHYRVDRAQNPDRIFFDLAGTRPSIDGRRSYSTEVGDKLLKRIRVMETTPGVTRVVLELESPAEFSVSRLDDPMRVIIELRPPTTPIESQNTPIGRSEELSSTVQWTAFSSKELQFSVWFCGAPSLWPDPLPLSQPKTTLYQVRKENYYCSVAVGDYNFKPDVEEELLANQTNFLKGAINGMLLTSRRNEFVNAPEKLPALTFTYEIPPNEHFRPPLRFRQVGKSIVILKGSRGYALEFDYRKDMDYTAAQEKFLSSFKITE